MLNEDKKMYKDLSKQEKVALFATELDERPMQEWIERTETWVLRALPTPQPSHIYRVEPVELEFVWGYIDPEWKWLARDCDIAGGQRGRWHFYEVEPTSDEDGDWGDIDAKFTDADLFDLSMYDHIPSFKTLIRRGV